MWGWIKLCELPELNHGQNVKVFTLLSDPTVWEELQNYVWSNKWSINPSKLAAFTWNELIPDKAKKYAHQIIDEEMSQGLKKYLEVELFPQIHMKVGKGISLTTTCHWLHHEGFCYMQYWKAIYFNGHN